MKKACSIKEVAREAGVSIATVSHVINNTKYVSPELSKKVRDTIKRMDYHVMPLAKGLKSGTTMTIGVIVTDLSRVFFSQLLKGIQNEANQNGYHLILFDSSDSFRKENQFLHLLEAQWVDGILLDSVCPLENTDYFASIQKLGSANKRIPIVSLERCLSDYGIDSVYVDNVKGGYLAAEHLLQSGCRRIAHIQGPPDQQLSFDRLSGYSQALRDHGLPVDPTLLLTGNFQPMGGYSETKKLLMTGALFDGVFAANDQMAIGALKACLEHGRSIPDDVKMVGFDNTFVSSLVYPALTTLDVPKYRMGQTAMQVLLRRIRQPDAPLVAEQLPISLIHRTSTNKDGDKSWDLFGW